MNKGFRVAMFFSLVGHAFLIGGLPVIPFDLKTESETAITYQLEREIILPKEDKIEEEQQIAEPKKEIEPPPEEIRLQEDEPSQEKAEEEIILRYTGALKQRIQQVRQYPRWARRQEWEGTVALRFDVQSTGRLEDVQLLHSSGFEILDKEAIAAVHRAQPFPAFPDYLSQKEIKVQVSIHFQLMSSDDQ